VLASLIRKYEQAIGGAACDFAALPMEDVRARAKGSQPFFSIEIETLEGEFKLFQERSEADTAGRRCRSWTSTGSGGCGLSPSTSTKPRRSDAAARRAVRRAGERDDTTLRSITSHY
jgi:hypothetical protein